MGFLGRLLRQFVGTEENSERHDTGIQRSDDNSSSTDKWSAPEPPDTNQKQLIEAQSISELIEELPAASGRRQPAVLLELLERAADNPQVFATHLDELFELLREDATAERASIVLDTLGAADPDLLANHTDRLVASLNESPGDSAEYLGNILLNLEETASSHADDLLDIVAKGPQPARSPATTVLGNIATTDPDVINIERLLELAREGDATSRGAALYLGTLLTAGDRDQKVPQKLVAADVVELAREIREGELDHWLQQTVSQNAMKTIVDEVSPEANCDQLNVVATPEGTHLMIAAGHPASVDRKAISEAIEQRIGIKFTSVKLADTGEDSLEAAENQDTEEEHTFSDVTDAGKGKSLSDEGVDAEQVGEDDGGIEGTTAEVTDGSKAREYDAIETLLDISQPREVTAEHIDELATFLKSEDPEERRQAVEVLGTIGTHDPELVSPVTDELRSLRLDSNVEVREAAMEVIDRIDKI